MYSRITSPHEIYQSKRVSYGFPHLTYYVSLFRLLSYLYNCEGNLNYYICTSLKLFKIKKCKIYTKLYETIIENYKK